MRRGPKPAKSKVESKPPVPRKSSKNGAARVSDLEKRLAEALQREAEALRQLQTSHRDRAEAQEQQAATAEILRIISSSPTDIQFVFDTIVRTAARLCDAFDANLVLADGDEFVQRAHHGPIGAPIQDARYPVRGTVSGRAISEARIIQVDDLAAATEYPLGSELAQRIGYRTTLIVPLVRDGLALGAIGIRRTEVKLFTDRQIALLKTFADQAVIAIENVRLFNETKEALEQQTATSEILQVIASSPTDLQPVLDAMAESAARLCTAYDGTIWRLDGDVLSVVAHHGPVPAPLGHVVPAIRGLVTGRTVLDRQTVQVADLQAEAEEFPEGSSHAREFGHRTILSVPLLREGIAFGAIVLRRTEVQPFTGKQISLLKTFADQAVIAIENVRLFKELQSSNRELTTALDQQTATSEVLRTIAQTKTDPQPVFDTIVRSAAKLCHAHTTAVFLTDGRTIHHPANYGDSPEALAAIKARFPRPLDKETAAGNAILTRSVIHVPDVEKPSVVEFVRQTGRVIGFRSLLSIPMLRQDEAVGAINVTRREPGPFSEGEVALLKTFADQAVIALENVRLFRQLEGANRELSAASQHKSEFLANMSHELRTPLNAIIGFSEVLSERMFGELNEKQEEYSKDIHASGQHLLSLINDILDLSKIEAGRMELELTDFHLPTALDSALTLVRERAARRGITLEKSVDERLGQARADERKVRQVVLNLLSNALKFTPEGGRIEVGAVPKDGFVEISVTDTGVGIAPEDQEAVFEEFRQVGTADKKVEGTGLGLTLCRKFIELHGGRIWVTSQVGVGSTFTFTIPVRRGE
jgi:two-component system, NtrC family, sensor kinase